MRERVKESACDTKTGHYDAFKSKEANVQLHYFTHCDVKKTSFLLNEILLRFFIHSKKPNIHTFNIK